MHSKKTSNMIGGSADLTGSVCTYHESSKPITKNDHDGIIFIMALESLVCPQSWMA